MFLLRRFAAPVLALALPLSGCALLPGRPATAPFTIVDPSYSDLADLTLAAPVIADLVVTRVRAVADEATASVAPGRVRLLLEGQVGALLTGPGTLPAEVRFLADLPADDRGYGPGLTGQRFLVFARPSGERPGDLILVAPDSLLPWTAEREATVRQIATEALAAEAPAALTGIASAFYAAGTLPGESTTQLFLATARGQPISLTILDSPGQPRRWGVSTGEVVGPTPKPPRADSLLWYRLACGLPEQLDPAMVEAPDANGRAAAVEDYAFVRQQLGPCTRIRTPPATLDSAPRGL